MITAVKSNEIENAVRSSHLLGESMTQDERNKEEIKRKIIDILDKLTTQKFDQLVDQIMKLQIDSIDKVNDFMLLIFEKAIDDEPNSMLYAKLCNRLAKDLNIKSDKQLLTKNLTIFRNILLDKIEHEFTDNVTNQESRERRLRPILEKLKECQDPDKKIKLQAQLEEEERKILKRCVGTVRFMGELFKLSMLTGNIMRSCISHLLDSSSEIKLECLCKLLTTVGKKYEATSDRKCKNKNLSLESVIKDMQDIVDRKENNKISSRTCLMIQEVIDLRRNQWVSTRIAEPKTMDQIQKEVKNVQISNHDVISNELADLQSSDLKSFRDIKVDEQNILHWTVLIVPENPPYNKGAFRIEITFPAEYPIKPPKIHFRTKIYHPNICNKGQVSLPIISTDNWKPATKTDQVIRALIALVNDPEPDHPLREDLAEEYLKDRKKFCKNAEAFTRKHSAKRPNE